MEQKTGAAPYGEIMGICQVPWNDPKTTISLK